jgi:hypothetical protein
MVRGNLANYHFIFLSRANANIKHCVDPVEESISVSETRESRHHDAGTVTTFRRAVLAVA